MAALRYLHLHLKKRWFNLIKAGVKKEEYRVIKPKYISEFMDEACPEFCNSDKYCFNINATFKTFDRVAFYLAYPGKKDKDCRIVFKNPVIRIGKGRDDWGAPPTNVFIISWGEPADKLSDLVTDLIASQKPLDPDDARFLEDNLGSLV